MFCPSSERMVTATAALSTKRKVESLDRGGRRARRGHRLVSLSLSAFYRDWEDIDERMRRCAPPVVMAA